MPSHECLFVGLFYPLSFFVQRAYSEILKALFWLFFIFIFCIIGHAIFHIAFRPFYSLLLYLSLSALFLPVFLMHAQEGLSVN